jgi:hypothetical protein
MIVVWEWPITGKRFIWKKRGTFFRVWRAGLVTVWLDD